MMRAGLLGAAILASAGMAMAQPAKPPAQGVQVSAEAGGIACQLGIRDDTRQDRRWMAAFELCESTRARIGPSHALSWRGGNVQHPDCRRTQRVTLVVGMKPL